MDCHQSRHAAGTDMGEHAAVNLLLERLAAGHAAAYANCFPDASPPSIWEAGPCRNACAGKNTRSKGTYGYAFNKRQKSGHRSKSA
jgi:hypothetical protein